MKKFVIVIAAIIASTAMCRALSLEECQQLARANYPLGGQYNLIELARNYTVQNAARAYLPQISINAQATYQNEVMAFPESMTAMFEQMGIRLSGLNKDQYRTSLELAQTLWDGGYAKAQKTVATAEATESRAQTDVALYALRERVDEIYFGIMLLDSRKQQNTLFIQLLQTNLDRLETLKRNGMALDSDCDAIKVEIITAEQQAEQIESAREAYLAMLSIFIGRPIDLRETLELPQAEMPATNHNSRPELELYQARTARLDADRKRLNASVMPRIGLFAQGMYGNPGLNLFKSMTSDSWTWNYIAGIRLEWNLGGYYTRGNNLKKIDLAKRQNSISQRTFLFNSDLQSSSEQIAIRSLARIMESDERIISLRSSIRQATEAKITNGTATASDLVMDLTAESNASLAKEQHRIEWLQKIYRLKFTLNN